MKVFKTVYGLTTPAGETKTFTRDFFMRETADSEKFAVGTRLANGDLINKVTVDKVNK